MSVKRVYALKCLAMVVVLLSLGMGMAVGQEQSQSEIDRIRLQQEKEVAESEKRVALIRARPWYKNFTPDNYTPEYNPLEPHFDDLNKYVGYLCENFVEPQFKKSDTPEEAVHQLETLMGQLGALYSFQPYIVSGQIGYIFTTSGNPLSEHNLGHADNFVASITDGRRPFLYPEMREELEYLKGKYSPFHPSRYVMVSDHEAKIFFGVQGAAMLDRLMETPELQSPPRYLERALESRDPELEQARLPYEWHFTGKERRDKFYYTYLYPLKSQKNKGKYVELYFHYSGKREKDRSLSDITLDELSCSPHSVKQGIIPAGKGVRPTVPDLVYTCDDHKKWYEKNVKKNACFQHGICKLFISATDLCTENK